MRSLSCTSSRDEAPSFVRTVKYVYRGSGDPLGANGRRVRSLKVRLAPGASGCEFQPFSGISQTSGPISAERSIGDVPVLRVVTSRPVRLESSAPLKPL